MTVSSFINRSEFAPSARVKKKICCGQQKLPHGHTYNENLKHIQRENNDKILKLHKEYERKVRFPDISNKNIHHICKKLKGFKSIN